MSEGAFSDDQQTAAGYSLVIKYEALKVPSTCGIRPNHKVNKGLKPGCKTATTKNMLINAITSVINVNISTEGY